MESRYRGHRFPSAMHKSCRVAIPSLQPKPARCRRSSRQARRHGVLRGHSQVVGAVRPACARALRRHQGRLGDIWQMDEVFISIRGERRDPWRAVDQDGDVLDIPVTRHRDARAARRFYRKLLKGQGGSPFQLVTDKLRSDAAASRKLGLSATHRSGQYDHNRAAVSHQHTRKREVFSKPETSLNEAPGGEGRLGHCRVSVESGGDRHREGRRGDQREPQIPLVGVIISILSGGPCLQWAGRAGPAGGGPSADPPARRQTSTAGGSSGTASAPRG